VPVSLIRVPCALAASCSASALVRFFLRPSHASKHGKICI
jgi:hypothetical protein